MEQHIQPSLLGNKCISGYQIERSIIFRCCRLIANKYWNRPQAFWHQTGLEQEGIKEAVDLIISVPGTDLIVTHEHCLRLENLIFTCSNSHMFEGHWEFGDMVLLHGKCCDRSNIKKQQKHPGHGCCSNMPDFGHAQAYSWNKFHYLSWVSAVFQALLSQRWHSMHYSHSSASHFGRMNCQRKALLTCIHICEGAHSSSQSHVLKASFLCLYFQSTTANR